MRLRSDRSPQSLTVTGMTGVPYGGYIGFRVWGLAFKDPNDRVLGPKYYNINGIWALKALLFGSLDPKP